MTEMLNNEVILAAVEAEGGGYVWDAECFAVTLMENLPSEALLQSLNDLKGVQQIAIEASTLKFDALMRLASIPGLQSLVLNHSGLSDKDAERLASVGPEIVHVEE